MRGNHRGSPGVMREARGALVVVVLIEGVWLEVACAPMQVSS